MDILVYDYIFEGMKSYNEKIGKPHGNSVLSSEPFMGKKEKEVSFPITIIKEIRNTAIRGFNSCHERLASVGYRVDIFAKTKGNVLKQKIAREIAQKMDEFMSDFVGLLRVSYNVSDLENDGTIYHIIMTYEGTLHENRRTFF